MTRRLWRNFDYALLGSLLVLAIYGIIMIYSATTNTLGVEDAVRRQILFVAGGLAVLLVTASIDYRLLEIVQHPQPLLAPLVLGLGVVGLAIIKWTEPGQSPTSIGGEWPKIAAGITTVFVVFAIDRFWITRQDLILPRALAFLAVLGGAGALLFFLNRQPPERFAALSPYLLVGSPAIAYLLDCLTLRISDALRNPLYVTMLALLGSILIVGQASGGSQRWLGAGTIQPSELAKILTIIVLAKLLADRQDEMERAGTLLVSLGTAAIPALLIYLQPDLGTSLTLFAIWLAMMWMSGIPIRYFLLMGVAAAAALPVVWLNLEDYMKERVLLFVNPAGDPDSYFNVHQALVSIGSGGWIGKGLTQGSQNQLHFLRVRHTDFIFAVTAEELGFLGAVAMIALILVLLWRVFDIAERSRDTFGRLLATGVGALILFQAVVNIGMNLGLLPVTGIPLPFVSYGGSSFLTLMLGIGLVESVAMRHKKLEFD